MSDEYSEGPRSGILARIDQWYEAFEESAEFARLSPAQQEEAGPITEFFAQY
jgi:hypothetical protein